MKVIVDTSIWSISLRRQKKYPDKNEDKLKKLILDGNVVIIGPIRQEILSGIKDKNQFNLLKINLSAFPDFPLLEKDYETAAEFFNICRAKGIQGSNTDYLICAVASNNNFKIFTLDKDFERYKKIIPIKLY